MNIQTKILIPLVFIFILMATLVTLINSSNQKAFVESVVMSQATQTAYQYFDSVNTMMISGTMDNREIIRNKLLENKEIVDVRIVRGKKVNELFGGGYTYEQPQDALDSRALNGETIKIIQTIKKQRMLTVIIPLRASFNYKGTNCIECHQVPDKTILGATRITYSLNDVDNKISENSIYVGKILAVLFTVTLIIVLLALKFIAINKLKNINKSIVYISQHLDLTKKVEQTGSQDEISKMSHAFDKMLETIRNSLTHVKSSTEKIVQGTEEIAKITALTISNIRAQKEETSNVAFALGTMSESSINVANNTLQSQSFTNTVEAEVADGAEKAHSAREKINELFKQIELVASIAEKLEKETHQISNTVKIIDDITLKTRLLSFNASVEASRAGEHGKGFTAIAREIGELAQQTKVSNLEIEKGTVELKNLMLEAVGVIRATKLLADDGKNEVNISYESFRKVADEMTKVKEVMTNIARSTQEQSTATKEVEANINSIMELSNQTTTAAERIGEVSSNFIVLAQKLDELIKKFKI